MNKLTLILLLLLVSACASYEDANDEYFVKSISLDELGLSCSNSEAIEIAYQAVRDEYPRHLEKLDKNPFSVFSPVYGDFDGKIEQRYKLKSILGFKRINMKSMHGRYYEESIEVSLSEECDLRDVVYFKGVVEYTI